MLKTLPWLVTPSLVVLLVLAWHIIVTAFNVNPFIFPPPGKVWDAFVSLLGNERAWAATGTTVSEIVIGFLIAAVLGVVVGVVLGKVQWLEVSLRSRRRSPSSHSSSSGSDSGSRRRSCSRRCSPSSRSC
jgi:NitT/TauT family transport system permease protein